MIEYIKSDFWNFFVLQKCGKDNKIAQKFKSKLLSKWYGNSFDWK